MAARRSRCGGSSMDSDGLSPRVLESEGSCAYAVRGGVGSPPGFPLAAAARCERPREHRGRFAVVVRGYPNHDVRRIGRTGRDKA